MTAPSVGAELRRYRALASALVGTLIVAVALFVQFLHMDTTRVEHAFSLRVAHAAVNGGVRITLLVERLKMIGRDYLLAGASDTQLSGLVRELAIASTLFSLCVREDDEVRVLHAAPGAAAAARERCAADDAAVSTPVQDGGASTLAVDLRIVPSASDDSPLLEFRMRSVGARELRATLNADALLDSFELDDAELGRASDAVCLSLLVDGAFDELACRAEEIAVAAPEELLTALPGALRVVEEFEAIDLRWRVAVTPDRQVLAGTIAPLPFLMFGVALGIGALICVSAYRAADRNLLLEARAKELRTRLEQLEQLKEQNDLLDHFAAMAAHDLQAPIRFIVSNAHLLISELDELEQPVLTRMAETQVEQGERMRALVVDLLEFCRAGQGELTIAPVDARALVDDEIRLLKAREEYAGTRIVVGSLPHALPCDASKFAQVIRNLLGNAVKFSQQNPAPKVSIRASRNTLHGEWTFRVRDNGPGVEEAHHERIFHPFARLDADAEGTGMGLAIVRKMLEQHGGTIWIDSTTADGSTFCFTMPGVTLAENTR